MRPLTEPPYTVPCPKCGRPEGMGCVGDNLRRVPITVAPHKERIEAAKNRNPYKEGL